MTNYNKHNYAYGRSNIGYGYSHPVIYTNNVNVTHSHQIGSSFFDAVEGVANHTESAAYHAIDLATGVCELFKSVFSD